MPSDQRRVPTVAIVGHKNSGKTTLTERLIVAFTHEGLRVCAIKHTSDEVGFDKPRTDSDRLKKAGAIAVGMVAKSEIGFYTAHSPSTSEAWIEAQFAALPLPPNLIIYEGYRGGPHPKIECILKPELTAPTYTRDQGLVAVVSDHAVSAEVPVFAFEQIGPILSLVRESFAREVWPTTQQKLH